MPRRSIRSKRWMRRGRSRKSARRRLIFSRRVSRFARRHHRNPYRSILNGFPKSTKVCLKYVQTIALNPSAGAVVGHRFRVNSLYDPDLSGTGHQPRGHDQLSVIYSKYLVTAVSIKATPVVTSSYDAGGGAAVERAGGYYGILLDDDETINESSVEDILEGKQGGGVRRLAGSTAVQPRTPSAAKRSLSLRRWFKVRNLFAEDGASAAIDANPTEGPNWRVWYGNPSTMTGTDPDNINFLIEMKFWARYYEPKYMAAS